MDLEFAALQRGRCAISSIHPNGSTHRSPTSSAVIANAAGKVTSFGYNAYGQLTSLTNAKGETVTMSYDANGFLTNVVGSLPNSKVSFTYDSTNHVRTVTDSQGYTITNSYDNLDRLIRVEYPDGTSEVTVYDKLDATIVKNRRNQWSRTIYDATRQPIVTADALGRLTYFDWCACGSLGSITDPMGRVTSWVRDIQGRVQSKYYPDLTHVDYAYETKAGRLKSITDARNQTKAFTYNIDNTLQQITYSNAVVATPSVSFTYDTNYVRVLTMTDGTGTTTYSYNAINASLGAGMLASIDGPLSNDTITYFYDELGRVTNQAINNVGVNVTYDSIGRVTVMTNALGTFTNTYDTNTLMLTSVAYPNGQSMNLGYFGNDHDRRLQTIWNKKGDGTTISKFDYTYDSDGQIQTWQQELGGVSTNIYNFTYDPVDQLLHGSLSNAVTGALIKQFFYQYDTAGNRTAEQIDMASASASFNNLNQMTSRTNGGAIQFKGSLNEGGTVSVAGRAAIMLTSNRFVGYGVATNGTNSVVLSATDYSNNITNKTYQIVVTNNAVAKTLSYDLNGNLTNEVSALQTNTYEWDAADRMVAMYRTVGTSSTSSHFEYDGMSRCVRIVEKTNGVVASDKRFLWCGTDRCEERDSTGATVAKRFFRVGEQISGSNYYFTVDHLASIREMTDTSGTVRARYDYDPYGGRTKLAGDLDTNFGFTGHYVHSVSGLYFAPFRVYDPATARWLSRDAVQESGGVNLYAYVENSPISQKDPLGFMAYDWHHVFVQEFESHFALAGINIHDKANGVMLPREIHMELHAREYNEQWAQFFDYGRRFRNEREIRAFAAKLMNSPEYRPFYQIGTPATSNYPRGGKALAVVGLLSLLATVAQAKDTACRVASDTCLFAEDKKSPNPAWAIVDGLDARYSLNQQNLFSGDVYLHGLLKNL